MVNPTGGFRPVTTAKVSTATAKPAANTGGTPAGGTPFGVSKSEVKPPQLFTLDNTPGGATPAATPASSPVGGPGVPAAPYKPTGDYKSQVIDLVGNIYAANPDKPFSGLANEQTLVDKPMVQKFIDSTKGKTDGYSQFQLAQAQLLLGTLDATDKWGAAKAGGALDGKVNVWEILNSTYADIAPYM